MELFRNKKSETILDTYREGIRNFSLDFWSICTREL